MNLNIFINKKRINKKNSNKKKMNSMANIGSSIMNANRTYQKSSSIRSARTQKSFMTTDSHFTRDTFNEQFKGRDQKAFINEANKIMRERMKNKGSTINSKSRLKSVVMNDRKKYV